MIKRLTLIIAITFMAGCAKDETFTDQSLLKSDSSTKTEFKLGNKIENAYSVENMKRAYDALMEEGKISKPISINTTHLYIKLTPKDSAEMNCILEDTVLELFPYPLDYELIGEGEYVVDDNATPELYTVIPADHKLDAKITFEKLEDCFIPDNYDENPELAELEIKALLLTNNITEEQLEEENNAKGLLWKYPKGYVKVCNTDNNSFEAVRGIKVRVHNIVKLTEIYTNGNGYYSSDRAFLTNVHYSAVFRNRKGFKIWSNYGPLSPAVHNVGWHSKNGYDITIGKNSCAWPWATINNATLDYYDKICPHFGINKPYDELRIWYLSGLLGGIMDGEWGGSAPMLRNLTLNTITLTEILTALGIMPTPSYAITKPLIYGIMLCLPDVFIAEIDTPNTNSLRRLIFHELSHASHYDQVGPAYWVQYMSEICYNYFTDPNDDYYGSTQNDHNGVIGVGEMWASYFAYQCTEKYYNYDIGLLQTNRWYAPQILKQIEENANNITPEKIYDALVYRVQTHDDLKHELISRYGQSQVINQAFANEGF